MKFRILFGIICYSIFFQKIYCQNTIDSTITTQEVTILGNRDNPRLLNQKATFEIDNKQLSNLGARDITESFQFAPSVYTSKSSGGFGDSKILMRGFSEDNISLFINGVPETAPDYGWQFWSNWSGLEPFIDKVKIEPGLNNQYYTSSVGGAISLDFMKANNAKIFEIGQNVSNGRGNNTYFKYSTGKLSNGWAIACGANRTIGSSYANGTNIDGSAYFIELSKTIKNKHFFTLTSWMAIQQHWQNANMQTDSVYNIKGIQFNNAYGYFQNTAKTSATNFYKRPTSILKYEYIFNSKNRLISNFSIDYGAGGAMRSLGKGLSRENNGLIDWQQVYNANQKTVEANYFLGNFEYTGLKLGALLQMNSEINKFWKTNYGVMAYSLYGHDYVNITDMLGGSYITNNANQNSGTYKASLGDKIWYDQSSIRSWQGLFGEILYNKNKVSVAYSLSLLNNSYTYTDNFQQNFKTLTKNFGSGNTKLGFSYHLNETNNIFANLGYQLKNPVFRIINNRIDSSALAEKNYNIELGYKINKMKYRVLFNMYYMLQKDKTLQWTYTDNGITYYANVNGVNIESKGIEFSSQFNVKKQLDILINGSLGICTWENNVNLQFSNNQKQVVSTFNFDGKNKFVGGSPQSMLSAVIRYKMGKYFNLNFETVYQDRYYAATSISSFSSNQNNSQSYKIPAYIVNNFNLHFNYHDYLKIQFQILNFFDTKYISDVQDGSNHDLKTALMYYAPGRNYMLGLIICPSNIYNKFKKQ